MDLVERLLGPHEWGYRDLADGQFVRDCAPFEGGSEIARLRSRLTWRHEQREGDQDHILRQEGNWTIGVTERADGTWSSVWMEAGRAVHSRKPPVDLRKLVNDEPRS